MFKQTKSFESIADKNSKVLILGTMPGVISVNTEEYYGNSDNLFWDIIFRVCIPEWNCLEIVSCNYETKRQLLLTNNIALWDVLEYCERKGSLDKDIRSQIHNDFITFFEKYPQIKTVFFNGKEAQKYFQELKSGIRIIEEIEFITLQSTSPRNPTNSFYILNQWMQIRNFIKN